MDYSKYENIQRGQIDYDIKIGLRSGEMPPEALMAKFDETNDIYTDHESIYDYYARNTLTDRRPDTATFAHEEPRQSIANNGYLNLIHYGTRSGSQVAHPEIFLGLTEGEPRGIATDPDYKQLRKQHEARNRFIYMGHDADNSITGGGWNEAHLQEGKQKMFKEMRPRMRIFSTAKDGRREGLRRSYKHVSDLKYITDQKKYGEVIKDWALNPQRDTTIFSNKLIRNTRMYHQFTTDHEFEVARYGDGTRRRVNMNKHNALSDVEADYEFNAEDMSKCFKAVGVIMGQLCRDTTPDMDYQDNTNTQIRKNAELHEDLISILSAITQDADFQGQDETIQGKSANAPKNKSEKDLSIANHSTPSNILLNGMVMSKGVKENPDLSKIRSNIVTTEEDPIIRDKLKDMKTQNKKSGMIKSETGKRNSEITVDGESVIIPNYKSSKAKINNGKRMKNISGEEICDVNNYYSAGEMYNQSLTQNRATSLANYSNPNINSSANDMSFSANTSQERHIAPIGNKYVRRNMDTDAKNNGISLDS